MFVTVTIITSLYHPMNRKCLTSVAHTVIQEFITMAVYGSAPPFLHFILFSHLFGLVSALSVATMSCGKRRFDSSHVMFSVRKKRPEISHCI